MSHAAPNGGDFSSGKRSYIEASIIFVGIADGLSEPKGWFSKLRILPNMLPFTRGRLGSSQG